MLSYEAQHGDRYPLSVSEERPSAPATGSYSQILKSSSLVGGAEGVSLLLGLVRIKFAAVLIGPAGMGLAGSLMAIQTLLGQFAGLGIN